jgi:predicted small lipoprotein YifL
MRRTTLILMLVVALAGCGLGSAQGPTEPAEASASAGATSTPATDAAVPSDPASGTPTATSVTGVLGGDEQLEGGCVWLDTDQGRIEPLWPAGFTVTTEPVTLLDPQGETLAREGDSVTIIGEPAGDVATICQVGELWNVSDVAVSDR